MGEAEHAGARPAPPLSLLDTAGEPWALPTGAAATVVVWTCNHCPYALAWHDRLVEAARDYADRGVQFVAVSSNDPERYPADGPEAMRERFEREQWPFPYLFDAGQDAARAWGARTTPHLFVLDPQQRIVYEGAPDADHQDPALRAQWLRDALDAVLGGADPPASTEPVGCSIKWKQ
ncbi:MAG: thioredoxin family protein [Vicinamibacteria bacterium]|jgi:peroxiredoxin